MEPNDSTNDFRLNQDRAVLIGRAQNPIESITRPWVGFFCTLYLWQEWRPLLEPVGFAIVVYLRTRIVANLMAAGVDPLRSDTGPQRITVSYADIAKACGCNRRTIIRQFHGDAAQGIPPNHALLQFVSIEHQFTRPTRGGTHQLPNLMTVLMSDPLTPRDEQIFNATRPQEARLESTLRQRDISPGGQNVTVVNQPEGQNVTLAQSPPGRDATGRHGDIGYAPNVTPDSESRSWNLIHQKDSESPSGPTESDEYITRQMLTTVAYRHYGRPFRDLTESEKDDVIARMPAVFAQSAPQEPTPSILAPDPPRLPARDTREQLPAAIEEMRDWVRIMAADSCQRVGDNHEQSIGFHIRVWRQVQKADIPGLETHIGQIVYMLDKARKETGKPQGRAWNRMALQALRNYGAEIVKETDLDPQELAEARAASQYIGRH
jgi:hypothetical protein